MDGIENLGSEPDSRRISMLTDSGHDHEHDHDRNFDGRSLSRLSLAATGGKLRKLAAQVTHAIRRKRRESAMIRRETRATRVVAAILGRCDEHG